MIATATELFCGAFDELASRCRLIGVPVWHFNAEGTITAAPTVGEALATWFGSADFVARLHSAAQLCISTKTFDPTELFPGAWFLPLDERDGAARVGVAAALIFTQAVFASEEFNSGVRAGGMEPDAVGQNLAPYVRVGQAQLEQTIAVIRWTHTDLLRGARDNATIEQFGEKLSQAYEETNLLFRLSRLLGFVSDPVSLVRTFCTQVQEIMPFEWLAVRFDPQHSGLRNLASHTIIAGDPRCGVEAISDTSLSLVQGWGADDWMRVLRPGDNVLADVTQSEVLAEPITFDGKVIGGLFAGNKRGPDFEVSSEEMQFLDAAASFLGIFHENSARFSDQRAMFLGVLKAMTASIDAKDPYTCGHSERVGLLASRLAQAAGLSEEEAERYRIAGLVHDVGKIGVPEAVLSKVGRLTDEEFTQIKQHPQIGHDILSDIPLMQDLLPGVLHHHERYDGRGYPRGLAGEQIPLIARVLALADTFDAMSSTRSYRPAMPREKVLEEIRRCAGAQFDPVLAEHFVKLSFAEFDTMLGQRQAATCKAA